LDFPGAVYHVINRGNDRRDGFARRRRRRRSSGVCSSLRTSGWTLHAYVVMRNHYHLALETRRESGDRDAMAAHLKSTTDAATAGSPASWTWIRAYVSKQSGCCCTRRPRKEMVGGTQKGKSEHDPFDRR